MVTFDAGAFVGSPLLADQNVYAARCEIHGEAKSHGTCSDNQNRSVLNHRKIAVSLGSPGLYCGESH